MASTDILWEFQASLTTILTHDTTLMTTVKGVYDLVPQNQVYPYVVIGESTEKQSDVLNSNQNPRGFLVTTTLHIWSQYSGFKEALQIKRRIYELLHRNETAIALNGFTCTWIMHDFSTSLRDPDGLTRHVPTRYRAFFEEN